MARCFGLVCYLILAVAFLDPATAKDYLLIWEIPPSADFYANWTSIELESVDVVTFNWTGTHDVAYVTKAEYDNCTKTNSLLGRTSPVNYSLTSGGTHYFICTVGTHCSLGQKVSFVVKDKASNAASALGGLSQAISILIAYFLTYHV